MKKRVIKGKHEPLISEELFMKVQHILRRKSNKDIFLPGGRVINEEGILCEDYCYAQNVEKI
jgi:hypothetical protein